MEDDKRVSVKAKDGRIRSVAIPEDLAKAFKGARWPFSGLKARAVQAAVRRLTLKLVGGGKIRYPYSPHDYRHRFAANLYRQTRDVFAVQKGTWPRELGSDSSLSCGTWRSGVTRQL